MREWAGVRGIGLLTAPVEFHGLTADLENLIQIIKRLAKKLADDHLDLTLASSDRFTQTSQCSYSCRTRGGCKQYTVRAHVFLMRILSACFSQPVVTVVQVNTATESRTDPTRTRGSRLKEHIVCVLPQKQSHFIAQCHTLHHLSTPSTCAPSFSSTLSASPASHPLLSEPEPCADPRCNLTCALA